MTRPGVMFPVGPHRVLVWSDDIVGVEIEGDAPQIDLARRMGAPSADRSRRLRLRNPEVDLLTDPRLELVRVDLDTRQPVPPLAVGAAPVAEIVLTDHGLTWVLDLSRLAEDPR